MTGQPRQPAGAPRGAGGQFASAECPSTYRILAALRPPARRLPQNWGSPAAPIVRPLPEAQVPTSAVAVCCPGCVYDSPDYEAARAWWAARDAEEAQR